nr:MAG TPA: hypothetical protein [Bacteriophage sp.]DAZ24601.1 MAG TPA: hypothetical protein [Caudoviricetes sp.]
MSSHNFFLLSSPSRSTLQSTLWYHELYGFPAIQWVI